MVVGIIAEYNPFHNGHRYQIEQIKNKIKNANIVAIMSGSFTQRGEPAILDKFTRAALAINGGCDLVLELPFVYAVRSAQNFARGGINILKSIGITDFLAFGAEVNDINLLKFVADTIHTEKFNDELKEGLSIGLSYANAMCKSLSKVTGIDEEILRAPNVILAIEYLREIKSTSIQPILIPRIKTAHNDNQLHSGISSAAAIRKSIYSKSPAWNLISESIDKKTLNILQAAELPLIERLFLPLITKIISSDITDLRNIYGMNEGLENKFIHAAHTTGNFKEFIDSIISQRYTRSRIQRLILYLITELRKKDVEKFNDISYARILAFNQRGRELLKTIKKSASIPIITKTSQHLKSQAIYNQRYISKEYQELLRLDVISTDIHSILYENIKLNQDFLTSPLYLPKCAEKPLASSMWMKSAKKLAFN